jgi:hypothetical protein
MPLNSENRPRPLLLFAFVLVLGLLLYNSIRLWNEIDAAERWARVVELLLVAFGAWVVVWPESFPPWRSSRRSTAPNPDANRQG